MPANQYRFISAVPLRGRARDYRYLTRECFTPRMETGHVREQSKHPGVRHSRTWPIPTRNKQRCIIAGSIR